MEWLGGFLLGIIVDGIRSVVAPATTDWLRRFVPSEQRKSNIEDNRVQLEIMEKLKTLGMDMNLVRHADKSVEHFQAAMRSQEQAFVQSQVNNIVANYQTQLEMNVDAAGRAEVARAQMNRILQQIEVAQFFSEQQRNILPQAQSLWEEYAKKQAEFAAEAYHQGSMMPMIYHSEMEGLIINRTAELQRLYDQQSEH